LDPAALAEIVAAPCPGQTGTCGSRRVRVVAIAAGVIEFLDGEPAATLRWKGAGFELRDRAAELQALAERALRVSCVDCGAERFVRDDCPKCQGPGGAARALGGRFGVAAPPSVCPLCAWNELEVHVDARLHVDFLNGTIARRVLDADPADRQDRGWHVSEVHCENCESVVARAPEIRCGLCGRSSLVRR
jgi:hypothetical protein